MAENQDKSNEMKSDTGNTTLQEYEYLFKLLITGDQATGKTCLMSQFVNDNFLERYVSTIGVDFMFKVVKFSGKTVKLQIWDTAGQERFRNITTSYYRGAHAILILFDVTDRSTFDHIENWLQTSGKFAQENCVIVLVGNKTDHPKRVVTKEEGEAFAEKHGIGYVETSVRDKINVNEPFLYITKKLLQSKGTNVAWWKNQQFE